MAHSCGNSLPTTPPASPLISKRAGMEPTQSKATSAGAISLTRCAFSYHYDGRAPVFTDVDLDVPRGARVVLVGANGAGKSTLLRIIGGRRKRSAGDAHVFGEDAFEHTALTLRVNLVTADWEDSLTLPVRQIVTAAVAAASASAARVAQLLDVLGLAPLLTAELHALSDGQRRRVQLFCKLLPERELILLDEATNSLDVLSRAALLAFLRTEAEARGATVIFCTHIFDGLDGWATSVAHLDGGRLRRHVHASALPAGASLYQIVTQWLLEYAREAAAACEAAAAAVVGYAAERGSSTEAAAAAVAAAAAAAAGVNLSLSEQLAAALLAAASGSTGRLDMLLSSRPVGGGGWVGRTGGGLGGGGGSVGGGGGGWAAQPKRSREDEETSLEDSSLEDSSAPGGAPPSLPIGWGQRVATIADGAFGSHVWTSKPPEMPDGAIGQKALALAARVDDGGGGVDGGDGVAACGGVAIAAPEPKRHEPERKAEAMPSQPSPSTAEVPATDVPVPPPAKPPPAAPVAASPPPPPPPPVPHLPSPTSPVAASPPPAPARSSAGLATVTASAADAPAPSWSPAPPSSLPPAAARMVPVLQSALAALTARVGTCSAAVGAGDAAAAAAEAAAIQALWTQAQRALELYQGACGGGDFGGGGGGGGSGIGGGSGGGGGTRGGADGPSPPTSCSTTMAR